MNHVYRAYICLSLLFVFLPQRGFSQGEAEWREWSPASTINGYGVEVAHGVSTFWSNKEKICYTIKFRNTGNKIVNVRWKQWHEPSWNAREMKPGDTYRGADYYVMVGQSPSILIEVKPVPQR